MQFIFYITKRILAFMEKKQYFLLNIYTRFNKLDRRVK